VSSSGSAVPRRPPGPRPPQLRSRDSKLSAAAAAAAVAATAAAVVRGGGRHGAASSRRPLARRTKGGPRSRGAAAVLFAQRSAQTVEDCEVVELLSTDLCTDAVDGGQGDSGVASSSFSSTTSSSSSSSAESLDDPTSSLSLLARSVNFYTRAASILVSYLPVLLQSKQAELDPDVLESEWRRKHELGSKDLKDLIDNLQGFYVKVGQVIATRNDLFPQEYSQELAHMVDSVNPFPFQLLRQTVEQELLGGLPLEQVFSSFDPVPLGSASIAQVHRATLMDGRVVAVKVQRPNIEPQLMSDISTLKTFTFALRRLFPVDYYTVTVELEEQLREEFDFIKEANAMDRIAEAMGQAQGGRGPVTIPRSIPGLVSKRVLCMEFVPGVPLSQVRAELKRQGIDIAPGSKAEQLFGRRLVGSLAAAFAIMIFKEGLFHADPHPGNVFCMPDGSTALIDFGQTKRLGFRFRRQVAELVIKVSDWTGRDPENATAGEMADMREFAESMGVVFLPSARPECALALSLWLFDTSRTELPGGYVCNELSPDNPTRDVASFPRDFVLLCRTTLLIRGLAMRLNIKFSLSSSWRAAAQDHVGPSKRLPPRKKWLQGLGGALQGLLGRAMGALG
ncbi:unnamed protein product, partial [Polarella glacialis]